jgi:filamentous hemagglutinin family protein
MHKIQFLFASLFLSNFTINHLPVKAQITPDNTLGNESSQINSNVLIKGFNADQINGGATRGSNLFHSFSEFNIKDGQRVYFANPSGVFNILTRVTGKDVSSIFGTLGVDGNANLFLMNPNGILFGKNASLDVQGLFVGTTANGLKFGNQGVFSATNPQAPALLTVNPNALVFSQQQSSAVISNQSQAQAGTESAGFDVFGLRVPDGKSLLLVGGNVSMDGGQLNAFGGRVELGGLAEPGNVDLLFNGDNLSLKFPENVTRADVSLTNQAGVFVQGAGNGDIAVNARNIEILGGSFLLAGIGQGLGTPETVAGDIKLNATGEILVGFISGIGNTVRSGSKGNGGNITIDTGSFKLQDDAQLATLIGGQGNAGDVTVIAKNAVSLAGNADILSTVEAGGVGKGGNININSATLSLQDGSQLVTITRGAFANQPAGRGDAGNVNVKVTGEVNIAGEKNGFVSGIFSSVDTGTVGNGGNITIDADSFSLRDGTQLASSTLGQGNAGNVTVIAKNAVSLADANIFSTVEAGGVGKGGNIDINAATLSLQDGSQLQTLISSPSNTQPAGKGDAGNVNVTVTGEVNIAGVKNGVPSAIFSYVDTGAVGNGGNITIDAGSLNLRDGTRFIASTYGQGNAGNVTVRTKDEVFLVDSAILSAVEAGGVGKGGNIDINAASLSLQDGAQLLTISRGAFDNQSAGRGDAGNVNVKVTGEVDIAGVKNGSSSGIRSLVRTGAVGNGGNITIDAGSLNLRDGAVLTASTFGQGNGGNVIVRAKNAVSLADSAILSRVGSGGVGNGGDIDINAASLSLQDGAQFIASTFGQGNAGNIRINAKDAVTIFGSSQETGFSTGLFVSSTSSGIAGDIEVNSPKITLDNGGILNAESASANGGNININSDVLLLRRGSQISTTAGTAQSGGDGGNINLNTKFIVAVPKENSDILANAFTGKGGNVNIQTQGIFGIEPRPKPTDQSDITASSELGVQGQVSIQKPDVDPSRGLIQLPGGFKDKSDQIDQLCGRGKKPLGRFVVVGKNGSIPSNPVVNPMQGEVDLTPLASLDESNSNNRVNQVPDRLMVQNPSPNRIVEAQAIVRGADGTLYLVAEAPNAIPNSRPAVPACANVRR